MAVLNHLLRRRPPVLSVVAASLLLALVCAVCSICTVSLLPPKVKLRALQTAGARAAVLIDLPRSAITDPLATTVTFGTLIARAHLLARLMTTAPALEFIGRRAGVRANQIAADTPVTVGVPNALTDAGSEQRAHQILLAADRYRLEPQSRIDAPIIDIYAQAPTPSEAERLANAGIAGLRDYLRVLAASDGSAPTSLVRLDQLGGARGGVINPGAALKVAALTFLFAFALSCSLLLAAARLLPKRPRAVPHHPDSARPHAAISLRPGATLSIVPTPGLLGASGALAVPAPAAMLPLTPWRLPLPVRRIAGHNGDWPQTTRVMPWMLAAFMAVLWLVPFDSIALKASLPIDLKLDRLVLPGIVLVWLLSLAAGGRTAPRVRLTKIHVAVGLFITLAFLSVLVNATSLNQSLELDTSVKQLPLLLAYLSLFFMVASVVRRSEVRPFLTYTLVLALVCGLGMIVEYKTRHNIFFDLSGKWLPGVFTVATNTEGYDSAGRLLTHGPTAHGLAAVSILAMALPIAIVRVVQAERWRGRLLYLLAAAVLMVAVFATQRKTGLLAPASAFVTLACFRPRELLKMAPVAAVLLIAVLIFSPGTVAPVFRQFSSQVNGGAPTTLTDRASRYDAIRPDVFTHLALGRGYGSYQPLGHRILDSEILLRLIEMGVLGLAAYLLLGASVIATARATIRSRDPTWAPQALAGAAAAVVFLVVGTLFDSLSFPQVPYVFLYLAALVAVTVKPPEEESPSWR